MTLKVFLIALSFAAPAGAAGPDLSLDWDGARRLALGGSPSLAAARATKEQAGHNYLATVNSLLPSVNFSHGLSRSGGDSSDPQNRWSASLSASQDLLDMRTVSSVKTARISGEKAAADYRVASASARQSLGTAFTDLLFAQKRLEVQRRILEIRAENARLIRLKYEGGRESKGNALYTEALAESSSVAVRRTERQLAAAQRSLLAALGLDVNRAVRVSGDLQVPAFEPDQAAFARALESSPRLEAAGKTLEAAKERVANARYYAWPTLRASGSYGWSGDHEFPDNKSWSMGLTLSLPLFSGGPTYHFNSLAAFKKALASAEQVYKAEKLSVSASLRASYEDYLSAAETARAGVSMKTANEERYSEAQVRYMAGRVGFQDLQTIEQNFVDSELNQLEYARQAHARKLALEQLLGVGMEER